MIPAPCPRAQHILGEALFAGALSRERHRAERFQQAFILVLVEDVTGPPATRSTWRRALAAVDEVADGIGVAGWVAEHTRLGVIVPDVPADDVGAICEQLIQRLRRALDATASVRVHAYPDSGESEAVLHPARPRRSMRVRGHELAKRGMDVALSLGLLIAMGPLFLAVAALVRLGSRGPILYRQVRIGHGARPFTMLKFRTMRADADPKIHQDFVRTFIKGSEPGTADTHAPFKLTNDPRITPTGHFLRSTSLDELPQLWNVLRGDMSLVGPRPPLPYEFEQYEPWHHRRLLEAKPGITGLWQVKGRSRTTFDDMVRLDLRYAKTPSVWNDIKILLATPAAVISGKGAC